MDRAREKVLEAERSHADIHRQLNSLEQQLTAAAEKEGAEEELRAIMDDQERELSQLREQVRYKKLEPHRFHDPHRPPSLCSVFHWKRRVFFCSQRLRLTLKRSITGGMSSLNSLDN